MQVSYALSSSAVAASSSTTLDVLLNFQVVEGEAQPTRRPLNLSVVIDRSGSMAGVPLRNAIAAAKRLVDCLTPEDYLSVVIYDDLAEVILPHQRVQDPAAVKRLLGEIRAGGCTNLSGGWLLGCEQVKAQVSPQRLNRVLLLTDGQANVGVTDPQVLISSARQQADQGIVTTTLGFGSYFNEDLLIGMANAAEGNFYFIQSPDEAAGVFEIEIQSLRAVAAQNLTAVVQAQPGVTIAHLLNSYRSQPEGDGLRIWLGDVYTTEVKQLALELSVAAAETASEMPLVRVTCEYQAIADGAIQTLQAEVSVQIPVTSDGTEPAAADRQLLEQVSRFRIAKAKDEVVGLADRGEFQTAITKLREAIDALRRHTLDDSFEIAEEIAQLDYYAHQLEHRRFDTAIRKEMRDQAYQGQHRDRGDLQLRGTSSGDAYSLDTITSDAGGIVVECVRQGGKLRVHVTSDGYDPSLNVQFPRSIRQEGVRYLVEAIAPSPDGSFYRASGSIRRLVKPGEENLRPDNRTQAFNRKPISNSLTAADLEAVDSVGDGILIQCVAEGKKLRARVVSDGYNPDYNIRFPRSIRELGVLYVVDAVEETKAGGSYMAMGKVRRLTQ